MSRTTKLQVAEPIDELALTIYVDGSMRSAPRRGGIGIRFVWVNDDGQEEVWDHALPATLGATNNEMELEAPSRALELATGRYAPFALHRFSRIVVRTDSLYVHDNLPIAISVWSKNQWTKSHGGAVLNVRDWKNLLTAMRRINREHRLQVRIEWKKGKTDKHTKAVDKLAKQSADSPLFGQTRPNVVRRKTTTEQVDPGIVRMTGQVMTVRVIQSQYLPPPRRSSRYKYEVVDEESAFYQKVDWAESEEILKRGHTYSVRMNALQQNPHIEEVLEEIKEDLTPYVDCLKRIGKPVTVRAVVEELKKSRELPVSPSAARRRLDRLVDEGQASKTRASSNGRPYLYNVPEYSSPLIV